MDATESLIVYLPDPARAGRISIVPGSGIVGRDEGERVQIDYEGAIYGQASLARFADRVHQAAGRAVTGYPTVARMWMKREDLRRIGTWDARTGEVRLDDEAAATALAAWLGVMALAPAELLAGGANYERRRALQVALGSDDPAVVARARAWARTFGLDPNDL
jgi:hypothetical protein